MSFHMCIPAHMQKHEYIHIKIKKKKKIQSKETILNAVKENHQLTYKGKNIRIVSGSHQHCSKPGEHGKM